MLALDRRFTARALKSRNLVRRFTVQAVEGCDMFTLGIDDLEKLKHEFPEQYEELFKGANDRLKCELLLKLEVINKCEKDPLMDQKVDINSRFARVFKYADISASAGSQVSKALPESPSHSSESSELSEDESLKASVEFHVKMDSDSFESKSSKQETEHIAIQLLKKISAKVEDLEGKFKKLQAKNVRHFARLRRDRRGPHV